MEAEILQDVITYLGDEVSEADNPILLILINQALRKVCAKRYPFGYTDLEKEAAVSRYRQTIFEAAVYLWSKQGVDGQSSHSENGISRVYEKENDIYFDVVPVVKII